MAAAASSGGSSSFADGSSPFAAGVIRTSGTGSSEAAGAGSVLLFQTYDHIFFFFEENL